MNPNTLTQQPETYIPTAEEQAEWMKTADDHLDEVFKIAREQNGATEYWQLEDAVNKRTTEADGTITREPIVILRSGDAEEEMPLADFLTLHNNAMEKSERIAKQAASAGVLSVEQVVEPPKEEVEVKTVDTIKQILSGGTFDHLFDPKFDELMDSLTDRENDELRKWQVEQAEIRNPDIFKILGKEHKDEYGNYKLDEEKSKQFINGLKTFGISSEHPIEDDIRSGVTNAKDIVNRGSAIGELQKDNDFMTESQMKILTAGSKRYRIRLKADGNIDPMLIKGVGGFDSWAGRGYNGSGSVATRETYHENSNRASIDQITDYATRETQLPKMEGFALELILTDEGPVYYGTNAHRVAAARLRGEPLRFDSIQICDARGK